MIIYNNIIPFKGFSAMNLFGIIFARKDRKITKQTLNHEKIHSRLCLELLCIIFYMWYFIEWFIKLFKYGRKAYYNISFEREAYINENNLDYLKTRKFFTFVKCIT